MNPDNRWVKMAGCIPWDEFEIEYAELFPSDTGNVAKPLRMALGVLIIQTKFQFADRELGERFKVRTAIIRNVYWQTRCRYSLNQQTLHISLPNS